LFHRDTFVISIFSNCFLFQHSLCVWGR